MQSCGLHAWRRPRVEASRPLCPRVEHRFLCDAMLGHLARDLRLLGYDAAYAGPGDSDEAVLARARREGRLLLTKDRALAQRAGADALLLVATTAEEVAEVLGKLALRPTRAAFLTRCTACGDRLHAVDSASLPDVPRGIAERHAVVMRCASCGRAYWPGTHVEAIEERLGHHLG